MVVSENPERARKNRGILGQADIKYLSGDKSGYTRQAQYKRKNAIRERIPNGFFDLSLIQEELEDSEREDVFEALFAEGEGGSAGYMALTAAVALAFEGALRRGMPMKQIAQSAAKKAVGRDLPDGIRLSAEADISVEVPDPQSRPPPAMSAAKKLDDDGTLAELNTDEQAVVLRFVDDHGVTTDEVTGEALIEWWGEDLGQTRTPRDESGDKK